LVLGEKLLKICQQWNTWLDITLPKPNPAQSPDLTPRIRGVMGRKKDDRTQAKTLDINDPELRNR